MVTQVAMASFIGWGQPDTAGGRICDGICSIGVYTRLPEKSFVSIRETSV